MKKEKFPLNKGQVLHPKNPMAGYSPPNCPITQVSLIHRMLKKLTVIRMSKMRRVSKISTHLLSNGSKSYKIGSTSGAPGSKDNRRA
eukprot:CAMPEP_0116871028 /NCGR_PEP_ID=MMETSP0463-20121206/1202_1 /TAXON_ID=181622 /ORGANISM="Strombidinopsis sp, Strain SopsisLIS2011" /LENGTH=86 /DNA_ID=CAMNT_0004508687 /DNA_START=987 /DNA_END=1247 /DNA_ORIENTATION=-